MIWVIYPGKALCYFVVIEQAVINAVVFCRNAVNDAQSDTAAPAADIAFVGMRMIVKLGRVKLNLIPVDIDKRTGDIHCNHRNTGI